MMNNLYEYIDPIASPYEAFCSDSENAGSGLPIPAHWHYYAEILYISAATGQRLVKLYDYIDVVIENQNLRVSTGVLNEIMTEAVALQQPPSDKGKRLKLFYVTQVGVKPPTFVIFVNDKELMHFSYTRYIENKIREAFGFRGTSLKFIIRERKEKDQV